MENYEKSRQKWRELIKKIFGTENITWRLDPENGQMYFSNKGIEQIKATVVFIAMTKTAGSTTKWAWAWAGNNRNLGRIGQMNRIMPADITEYKEGGGTFEKPQLFETECFLLGNAMQGKYIRAKMMDILDGQFVFEGDINGSNAIFVILKAKKIKQSVPEPVEDVQQESDSTDQNDDTRKSVEKTEKQEKSPKKDDSDEDD